jgi:hypothetical protein
VNLRVIGIGATRKPRFGAKAHAGSSLAESSGFRGVRVDRGDGPPLSVPTYTMDGLRPGDSIAGPCLIDGSDHDLDASRHGSVRTGAREPRHHPSLTVGRS